MNKINYPKAVSTALLAVYGAVCAFDTAGYRFLDRVDLISHEAGHLLFSWFGEFLQVLGGTIGQLIVPAGFTVYFHLRHERFSSAVTLFWTGQNLFNISVYIKDARTMSLPLVSIGGGEDRVHDWNYLLMKLGLLQFDHAVGTIAFVMGLVLIIVAVVLAGHSSIEREGNADDSGGQAATL